jgi:hypothetical protein
MYIVKEGDRIILQQTGQNRHPAESEFRRALCLLQEVTEIGAQDKVYERSSFEQTMGVAILLGRPFW